jgi:hypothetical protein
MNTPEALLIYRDFLDAFPEIVEAVEHAAPELFSAEAQE